MNYAPVAIFTYNRLEHTRLAIESLKENLLASKTDIFVFSDGPRKGSEEAVENVRKYIDQIDGFNKIEKRYSNENKGLASSIIQGVTEIVKEYGKIIVLEDDLISSTSFLLFMNNALDYFENRKSIWSINGWNPSKPSFESLNDDIYFTRLASSWGWGTWADRWEHFEKKPENLIAKFTRRMIRSFNLEGNCCFWPQVLWNITGKYNTWAIFWYATVFVNNGLCVSPVKSYLANIGQDGSGEHCNGKNDSTLDLSTSIDTRWDIPFVENRKGLKLLRKYYREPGLIMKVYNKVKNWVKYV